MAAVTTLQSREIPPSKPELQPPPPRAEMEITYTGNTGNDMGISTMGFRASKYSPNEWHETNYGKYYHSFADRDNAERIRHESKRCANETEATTNKTQAEVTKKLGERIQDINFWKFELEREIRDVISETDVLLDQKKRLENALRATEIPLHISTDNLNCRQRRTGVDLVQDSVELGLLKEVEMINNVQDLLRKTTDQAEKQIKLNREAKQNLEMDWSDKKDALEIDTASGALRNGHTNKQFYSGAAKFEEIQSTPESWAQYTHDNIVKAEHERMASIQLRQMIDNILEDTSRDMREQCDTVDLNFQKRIEEMEDAKTKMEENLQKICDEIAQMEKNIDMLRKAIRDKENPMKVSQTRLDNRTFRPGVELCRDPVQYKLVGEVNEISQSIDALTERLNNSENSRKDLQDNRMALEKEISTKKNSIFIDRDKCVTVRTRYPTTLKLQGYQ
ncbi:tektin-4-like [Ylistrum balloti]|uniref:tektin-4-like n=1 Tax=Ylistrum balloti TaxID=509963 RepID=UPI0029057F0F|nr:tektin-4-like [Ylistrum balloti]